MAMVGHRCGLRLTLLVLVTCLTVVMSRTTTAEAHGAGSGSFPAALRKDLLHGTSAAPSADPVCVKPDLCTCWGKTANCSRHYGNLTYVPVLPSGIEKLDFSYNNLTSISSDAFFGNVTLLRSIDLQHNGLRHVTPGVFGRAVFHFAIELRLDYNPLTYSDLAAAFATARFNWLSLRHMDLGPLEFVFGGYPTKFLTRIDFSENRIATLNLSVLEPLRKLTELKFERSYITSMISAFLPRLTILNLSFNYLSRFPDTCSRNGTSLYPRLGSLVLIGNTISDVPFDICLPKLTVLDLSGNHISWIKTDMFSGERFPNLVSLILQNNEPTKTIERFAFRNPSLKTLTLMFCNINFIQDAIDPDCFAGLPKLKTLVVGHNYCSGITDKKFSQLFGSLSNLEFLDIGACNLLSTKKNAFSNMTKLTTLLLYLNALITIPDGTFDGLLRLTILNLGSNRFQTIPETLFSPATRQRLRHLDLGGNPFVCDCDVMWFRHWFVSSPIFNESYRSYTCSNDRVKDFPLSKFSMREQVCMLSHQASSLIMFCVVFLVALLVAGTSCYHHRWHIRLLLYEAFRGKGELRRRQRLEAGVFDYDVFVCYAQPDLWWVRHQLMPQLEDRLGLRLCVHERDFIPGQNIVDNIDSSVTTSKKIMMVFSKKFADSQWCQFELALCLQHVISTDDALIIACLEDAASFQMTSTMMAVLKTTTYIQWDQNPDAMASFWGRLEQAVGEILPARV